MAVHLPLARQPTGKPVSPIHSSMALGSYNILSHQLACLAMVTSVLSLFLKALLILGGILLADFTKD